DENVNAPDTDLNEARQSVMDEAQTIIDEFGKKKPALADLPKTPLNRLDEVELTVRQILAVLKEKGVTNEDEVNTILEDSLTKAMEKNQASTEEDYKTKTIRVPYVPDFVKQDIRDDVRSNLRTDVVNDVLAQATQERWGIPQALPAWIDKIKIKGDMRMRAQGEFFAKKNIPLSYPDFLAINKKRSVNLDDQFYQNTTVDRQRARVRVRVTIDGKVTQGLNAKMRFSTGSASNPVSTNQSLGNYGASYSVLWDQMYMKYTGLDVDGFNWVTASAGKMKNPWLSTDLLWDSDFAFEGFAGKFRFNLRGGDDLLEMTEEDHTAFITLGAFTLQEEELSSRDKWLFGAQAGVEWIFENQSKFSFALSYYDFVNINGKTNSLNNNDLDFTAPPFVQKGNTMVSIANSTDPNEVYYALAGDYNILNFTLKYDMVNFAPYHVNLVADYVKNIGFSVNDIVTQYGISADTVLNKTNGYQVGLYVGWPIVKERGRWRVFTSMKYLEANAVVDAFTDSDFPLGGTNAKGFVIGGEYSTWDNSWFTLRWLSADEIDGSPLGIDILQVDLNAVF
ncbi:MAG: putative porin, partial [Gammaproteobacteria bacterium]|nr:putative porin [Gammaproteobacteria bacterium]